MTVLHSHLFLCLAGFIAAYKNQRPDRYYFAGGEIAYAAFPLDFAAKCETLAGMSVMISEVYEAFRDAGVSDEEARAAAESIASLEPRLDRIDAELSIIKWIVSGIGFGVLLLVLKSFWPS